MDDFRYHLKRSPDDLFQTFWDGPLIAVIAAGPHKSWPSIEAIKAVQEAGISLDYSWADTHGSNHLLNIACHSVFPELTQMILVDSDPNVKVADGAAPLHILTSNVGSVVHKDVPFLQHATLLVKAGADVNAPDGAGRTPLHYLQEGTGIAKLLIEAGAEVNVRDSTGQTPLHCVTSHWYGDSDKIV